VKVCQSFQKFCGPFFFFDKMGGKGPPRSITVGVGEVGGLPYVQHFRFQRNLNMHVNTQLALV